ncbi:uncharacterized protein N7479_006095, partial [Penicillium vulpinum]|uniref:uncharacterized protein n=1 Tax=Penicillium vulpinum TaxID=29845 RepID=UPI0025499763
HPDSFQGPLPRQKVGSDIDRLAPPPFCLSLTSSSPVFEIAALLSRSFPTPEGLVLSTFI